MQCLEKLRFLTGAVSRDYQVEKKFIEFSEKINLGLVVEW